MKFAKHKDFDSFLDALLPTERSICLRLRGLILDNFPELRETWAYGAPFYKGESRICFLYPASLPYSGVKEGVNFGFNRANLLSNEHGLLDLGDRKEVAYIAVSAEKDIREALFLEILHEAVILDKALIFNDISKLMTNNITIRPAREADIPTIHALVYELAVYEKEPEAVFTTPEEYLEDFRNGLFESHVAELDGKVVGMTLFFMMYSSWKGKMLYLDDFVVNENYRGYGVGQKLYDDFIEEGRRRGCRLVKWQVLDWNEPAINFYKKNQAIIEKGWWNVKKFLFET